MMKPFDDDFQLLFDVAISKASTMLRHITTMHKLLFVNLRNLYIGLSSEYTLFI